MAKYTAKEFRQIADAFEPSGVVARIHNGIGEREIFARDIVAMLRQSADMIEREGKREKKYEYAEMYSNGDVGHEKGDSSDDVNRFLSDGSIIVRREVGEWEEV